MARAKKAAAAELAKRGINPAKVLNAREGYCPHAPTIKQREFLALDTREAFYGGSAGGGKSDALLMAALEFVDVPGYAALILRRTFRDLNQPDAIMSRAKEWLIGQKGVDWNANDKRFTFASGATLTFGYLESEDDKYQYQGAAFQFVGYDELTQFSETQYTYLFSRCRRGEGSNVPLRIRSASNPGGKGHEWVKARFVNPGNAKRPFIPARLEDNPHLDRESYMEGLMEMDHVTRAQLLSGDWDAIPEGKLFKRHWFKIVEAVPSGLRRVRFWDLAATEEKESDKRKGKDPDWTVGGLVGLSGDGGIYIIDIQRDRLSPKRVEDLVRNVAALDGRSVAIRMEEEGGSSGKNTTDNYTRRILQGYDFKGVRSTGPKEEYARPLSAQTEAGNVHVVLAPWNEEFFREICAFKTDGVHDDQVDAVSKAYAELAPVKELTFY